MKTSPFLIFISALLCSVAGFFLRLRQLSHELLPGGFLAEGSYMHILLLVLTAVLLAGLCLLIFPLKQRASWRNAFSPAPFADIALLTASLGLLVGNLMHLASDNELPIAAVSAPKMISFLNTALPILGLLSAGCLAAFAITRLLGKKPSPLFFMVISIWLTVRLIVYFQSWNTDPSIHVYCYQLLAAICTMLGSFQLAGFSFDKGKRRMSLFWCLSAVFFCAISTADVLRAGSFSEILLTGSLLLSMIAASFLLLFCPAGRPKALQEDV